MKVGKDVIFERERESEREQERESVCVRERERMRLGKIGKVAKCAINTQIFLLCAVAVK